MSNAFAFLGETITTKSGTFETSKLADIPAIAIYFSAHWCPPCRNFTPVLADFYNEVNKDSKQLEIIFVSCDQGQEQFDSYYGSMPWAAVPFDPAKKQAISQKIPFSGIPYLVVMNKDGSIKSTDGRADVSNQGPACIASWKN